MKINNCICCNSNELELILDLGDQPWCNDFLTKDQLGKEEYYPLQLMKCKVCNFLQLSYFVPKEKMFKNHDYLSGTTSTLAKHFYNIANNIKNFIQVNENDLIIDIGGNDGTNLLQYKKLGYNNLLNVESGLKQAEISINNNINTITDYFNEDLINKHPELINSAKVINTSGVFFHLEEIHSVLRGIKKILNTDGILCVQFMYVIDMIKNKTFDMIYHEHLFYYTIETLENLIKQYDLEIVHCYHSDIHSGSMIAYIKHTSPSNVRTDDYWENLAKEKRFLHENPIEKFAEEIRNIKWNLYNFIIDNTWPSDKIYALGAPAKGNTLMNYFEIGEFIEKVHEINPLKIGKYTPYTHIPITKESYDDLPDYYVVLSHNFFDEIIEKNQEMINKGVKFICPFPEIKII